MKWPRNPWARCWMLFAGLNPAGRIAMRIAAVFTPRYKARQKLARYSPAGFVAGSADLIGRDVTLGRHVFIGERVTLYQAPDGGAIEIGEGSAIHQDCVVETGRGGRFVVGANTHIQSRVQVSAYLGSVILGDDVQIAPHCAFYPYDHGVDAGVAMRRQPLTSRGDIEIGDDVWLGFGVVVLDGVRIGDGAVIGAGAVVTRDVPAGAIAHGSPARVVRMRDGASPAVTLEAASGGRE